MGGSSSSQSEPPKQDYSHPILGMSKRPHVPVATEYGNAASFWVEYPNGLVDLTRTTHLPKGALAEGDVAQDEHAAPVPPLVKEAQVDVPVDGEREVRIAAKSSAIVIIDMQKWVPPQLHSLRLPLEDSRRCRSGGVPLLRACTVTVLGLALARLACSRSRALTLCSCPQLLLAPRPARPPDGPRMRHPAHEHRPRPSLKRRQDHLGVRALPLSLFPRTAPRGPSDLARASCLLSLIETGA